MPTATIYKVYADHPEAAKLAKVAAALADGAIVAYPTDTVYALGCDPRARAAVERLRVLKPALRNGTALTLLCPSLDDLARYAYVDDAAFRLLKALTPGPYTFIFKATKEVPRLVQNPRRKTVGLRIPRHPVCRALLGRLGGPLVTTSAPLELDGEAAARERLVASLAERVDCLIDDGAALQNTPSTIIDLTTSDHVVTREGLGMDALRAYMR
jgi:tRNA threonylcarbamoyl adenosine modification protein (Sua5/YciO/YrdC/YwlC family)